MLTLAHRGYHAQYPENTMDAFMAAYKLGVDGIETDLRLTRDGEVILFHDRCLPDGRAVAHLTRVELSHAVGYEVATLAAALEAFGTMLWNLELKTPATLEPALAVVDSFSDRRILFSSFWHPVALEAKRRSARPTGLLLAHCPLDLNGLFPPSSSDVSVDALVWHCETVDPLLLEHARARGIENLVYSPQSLEDHAWLGTLGIEGIITDFPERVPAPLPRPEPEAT